MYTINMSANGIQQNWRAKGSERVIQNVQNLLALNRYEVAYNRTLGMDNSLIDKPSESVVGMYTAEIIRIISDNEPRATVVDVAFLGQIDGKLNFKVVIDIVG